MYPLGHIGITLFLSTLLCLPAQFAIIGALLPDVDKILFAAGLTPSARFAAHTLLFGLIIGLITFLLTKRKMAGMAILFGSLTHLLEDATDFIPWFYPFINYQFTRGPLVIITPLTILFEILGTILLIGTVVFNSKILYYRNRVYSWLKTSIS